MNARTDKPKNIKPPVSFGGRGIMKLKNTSTNKDLTRTSPMWVISTTISNTNFVDIPLS